MGLDVTEVRQLRAAGAVSAPAWGFRLVCGVAGVVGVVQLLRGARADVGFGEQLIELLLLDNLLVGHLLQPSRRWIETSLLYHNYGYL